MFVLFLFLFNYFFQVNFGSAVNPPSVINYQGKLLENGSVVTTTKQMYFLLYDAESGGSIVYTASGTIAAPLSIDITPSNGIFSVDLGDGDITNSLDSSIFANNNQLYLEVRVGAQVLSPRKRITSSAYALNSQYLNGVPAENSTSSTHIPISNNDGSFNFSQGFSADSGLLYVSSTIDKIGFNTTTPQSLLHLHAGNFLQTLGDPEHIGGITDDNVGGSANELDGANSVFIRGNYAYVVSTVDDGLDIFDISDPSNPKEVGYLTDNATTALDGAYSVYVQGNYAYVASYTDEGLEIIDVSDPTNPTHVGAIFDDGVYNLKGAHDVYVQGNYAYVASYSSNALVVIDISNPNQPRYVSSILDDEVGGTAQTLEGASAVYVQGNYAYVASELDDGIDIIDISDPLVLTHKSTLTDDATTFLDGAYDLYVRDKYLYVVSDADNGLEIIDISDLSNPTHVGGIADNASLLLNGANGLFISGNYAYIASYSDNGIEIINIANPSNVFHVASLADTGTISLANPTSVFVKNNNIYITSYSEDGLDVLEFDNLTAPSVNFGSASINQLSINNNLFVNNLDANNLNSVNLKAKTEVVEDLYVNNNLKQIISDLELADSLNGSKFNGIYALDIQGNYAYVVSLSDDSLTVVDISDPNSLVELGYIQDDSQGGTATALDTPRDVVVQGNYAYVVNFSSDGLGVFDISDPYSIIQVGQLVDTAETELNYPTSIFIRGTYAYITGSSDDGLEIVDISDPNNPVHVGSLGDDASTLLDGAYDVYVQGKYAYVVSTVDDGLEIVDISDPNNPVHVGSIQDDNQGGTAQELDGARSLYVQGKYAYIASYDDDGLEIIDISDPSNPTHAGSITDSSSLSLNGASSVYVINNYVFVGSVDEGLQVLDASDLSNLLAVESKDYTLVNNDYVTDIEISGQYIFEASEQLNVLRVLKFSGLSSPGGSFGSLSANNLNLNEDLSIGGELYVKNSIGAGNGLNISGDVGLKAGNIIQKNSNPTHVGSISDDATTLLDGAVSVKIVDNYAYIAGYYEDGLEIVDISDSSNPTHIGSIAGGAFSLPIDLYVSNNYVYMIESFNDAVKIIDVSNPSNPINVGSISDDATTLLDGAVGIYVSGKYAYVASYDDDGLEIIDISDPSNPTHVGSLGNDASTLLDGAWSVYVSGKYAYVASYDDDGLEIIDISDPSNPTHVGSIQDDNKGGTAQELDGASDVYVSGKYAYVIGHNDDGLEIIDISDPSNPTHVGSITDNANTILDGARSIYVSGNYAYIVSDVDDGLEIIDISDPSNPTHVGSITDNANTLLDGATDVYVHSKYAYVTASDDKGLEVLDISGLITPGANIGSLFSSTINVSENLDIGNDLYVRNGLVVGGKISSLGEMSITASSTSNNAVLAVVGTGDNGAVGLFDRQYSDGTILSFRQAGTEEGSITVSGATVSYNAFTGSHYAWSNENIELGYLVSLTGDNKYLHNSSESEIVYGIKSTNIKNDPQVIGTFLGLKDPSLDFSLDNPYLVSAVGNGEMWVVDNGVNINVGDPLISSNVLGHGEKDLGEYEISYVVARAGEIVDWSNVNETINGVKHKKISVFYTLETINNLYKNLTVDNDNGYLDVGSVAQPLNLRLYAGLIFAGNEEVAMKFKQNVVFESENNDNGLPFFRFNVNKENLGNNINVFSVRFNNQPLLSIDTNGDLRVKNNIYAKSLIAGEEGQPGDIAEKVDIKAGEQIEAGDVLIVDPNNIDTYSKSQHKFEQAIAGVAATKPAIVIGNGKTNYTTIMTIIGRVPVKVTNSNGEIKKGDLLVSSDRPGYAMRYDASQDDNLKMVGVIGVALEDFNQETGKIMALVRAGWVNSRYQTIEDLKNNLQELAEKQIIKNDEQTVVNVVEDDNGQLVFKPEANVDLNNFGLFNVANLHGVGDKWQIDDNGRFITKLKINNQEKTFYSLQSENLEYVFSGSSQLINGEKRIEFSLNDQAMIDSNYPLKISVTLTSEANGIYITNKDQTGFTVKELNNGHSSASFDWLVIATRKNSLNINYQNSNQDNDQTGETNESTINNGQNPSENDDLNQSSSSTEFNTTIEQDEDNISTSSTEDNLNNSDNENNSENIDNSNTAEQSTEDNVNDNNENLDEINNTDETDEEVETDNSDSEDFNNNYEGENNNIDVNNQDNETQVENQTELEETDSEDDNNSDNTNE